MGEFRMPSLGADMEQGTIVEWRVAPGDTVHRGDIVAVIETDKSTLEVEVFEEGTVTELLQPEGAEVDVGAPLAFIEPSAGVAAGEPDGGEPVPEPVPAEPAATEPIPAEPAATEAAATEPHHVVTSPVVRHLAEEAGVDLDGVVPTGPGGHVTRADVERAARAPAAPPPAPASVAATTSPAPTGRRAPASPRARKLAADQGIDLGRIRGSGPAGAIVAADLAGAGDQPPTQPATAEASPSARRAPGSLRDSIAALMSRSKREIPHYYVSTTIDLDATMTWLASQNADRPVTERLLPVAVLLRAVAVAAVEVPVVNGWFTDGGFQPSSSVDLGVAISLRGGGLVAPSLNGADELAIDELMTRLRDLVARARKGVLRGSEMAQPSITVTNLGDQGAESVLPVIYPPQVAMVGLGKIVDRPWAVDGMLTVRPVVTATLAADHRANDGHDGARFLTTLERRLQDPEGL